MEKLAHNNNRKLVPAEDGFVMVEALVGIVIASILLVTFTSLSSRAITLNRDNVNNFRANMYLKELIEITKDLEQSDWGEIKDCNIRCKPSQNGNTWGLAAIADINNPDDYENIDNKFFKRWIIVENVNRDLNNKIAEFGNSDDKTKKIIAHIEWDDGTLHEMKLETYVYDFSD